LSLYLDSLEDSGDLEYKEKEDPIHFFGYGTIAPTPKSLSTIATYNEDRRKHNDMVTMSRRHLWVGWAMFSLAAATLIVKLDEIFKLW
jgi:hypothetical protein